MKKALITTSAVLLTASVSYAQGPGMTGWGYGPGMMGWGYGMGWFGTILMAVFWIAILVGLVFLIRWVVVSTKPEAREAKPEDSAMEILKKRYARGEIDKQEFEEKKKALEA
jgi:putative membrane protein